MRERIYNSAKLHAAVSVLKQWGISPDKALKDTGLAVEDIEDDKFRVSTYQILRVFKNISDQEWDPFLPYEIGSSVHLSAYGLYGYALLCSTSYRDTVEFAQKYHHLAASTSEIRFAFEDDDEGWNVEPVVVTQVDQQFYAFLVCLQMGIHHTLHRDVMGPDFKSHMIEVRFWQEVGYRLPDDAASKINYGAKQNRFHIPSTWMDKKLELGNELTFKQIVRICDTELSELVKQDGVAGQVRKVLLENAAFASSMDAVAEHMGLTSRTLRRQLKLERTTYSEIVDSTRTELALRYLRAAELSTEEIAHVLGFSETASFVRAFRRWTGKTPRTYRMVFAA